MVEKELKKFFEFLRYNENLSEQEDIKIDFSKFEENKAFLIERFGGYIYKTSLVSNEQERLLQMEKVFLEYISIIEELKSVGRLAEEAEELMLFIKKNGLFGFKDNTTTIDFGTKIKAGMRFTKAVGMLLKKEGSKFWAEWAQTQYSKVTARAAQMSGFMHLSVHPIDFITMSESGYNWSSCQNINGDYAAGTLSFMNDISTFVAYVTNTKEQELRGGGPTWWKKKWRCLVHISPSGDKFIINKHYPFYSSVNEAIVVEQLKSLWPEHTYKEPQELKKYAEMNGMQTEDIVEIPRGRIFFSDINSNYDPTFVICESSDSEDPIRIGESVACCKCGDANINDPITFSCHTCAPAWSECEACHCIFLESEVTFNQEHQLLLCGACYSDCEK